MDRDRLIFEPETHTYKVGDKVVPSVTQILKAGGHIDDRWFNSEAALRGTAVHQAVNLDIRGELDIGSIHPIVAPYFQAWQKFFTMSGFDPDLEYCEKRLFHDQFGYAGTPDLVGYLNGSLCVIDVKTGASAWAGMQISAYEKLLEKYFISIPMKRYALKLRADATFRLVQYHNENDWLIFLASLRSSSVKDI